MRLITQQEFEFVQTVNFSLMLKSKDRIFESLHSMYDSRPDDPETAFHYGICLYIYSVIAAAPGNITQLALEAHAALSCCLYQREDWWLARFVRSELFLLIPDGFLQGSQQIKSNVYQIPADKGDEDRALLIEQQNRSSQDLSYFLCPYVSQALAYLYRGDIQEAIEWYEKCRVKVTLEESPFRLSLLMQSFVHAAKQFQHLGYTTHAEEIKRLKLVLFPTKKKGGPR